MKYVDEFRDSGRVLKISKQINKIAPKGVINIMEVCGTHTQNFYRFGLDKLLPINLKFISGPGCPVCVSSQDYIDNAIYLAREKDVIIVTFGDMLRIPGSKSSLEEQRAKTGNIRVVYSPLESLKLAKINPDKKIVFLAVGFETTAPTIALTVLKAKQEKINNLFFLISLKLMPPAMRYLLEDKRVKIDGFLLPGHVSVIIGTKAYEFIPHSYGVGGCVAGFEPLDILTGIYNLLKQIKSNNPRVANEYVRLVNKSGNLKAQALLSKVFVTSGSLWRGFGSIPKSGLKLRDNLSRFDAEKFFGLGLKNKKTGFIKGCKCGDVLKGLIIPTSCRLFGKLCIPENPIGPCMVSSEGACNAYYKYKR